MHPDIIAACARLHAADLQAEATESRRVPATMRRQLRTRLGLVLVRAGTRLAAPGVTTSATPRVTLAQ